jgi:hypothetical protein
MQMSVTIDLILIIINLGGDSHHGLGFFIPNPKNTIHIRFNRLGTQAWINSRNFEMLVCHGHAFMDTFRTKMNILNIIHIIGLLQKSSINSIQTSIDQVNIDVRQSSCPSTIHISSESYKHYTYIAYIQLIYTYV